MNNNKLRVSFLKKCCELSPFIRVQDLEDTIYHKQHQLLKQIFNKKQHFKLMNHNKLLIYPIENDNLSEFRIDLDNKDLSINIETMFKIKTQLEKFNIVADYEFTGSKGAHIKFLCDVSKHNLTNKYAQINLKEFEIEFRSKNKLAPNYKQINNIAKERLDFKKQLARHLGLYNIISKNDFDTNLLSSFYLLGCPGSVHRNTGKNKLYLNLNVLNSVDKVLNFINKNPISYINFNFLKQVWTIPNDFKFIPTLKTKSNSKNKTNYESINHIDKEIIHTEQENLIKTFSELYSSNKCESINGFSLYVINICYSFNFSLNNIKPLHNKLFDKLELTRDPYICSDDNIINKYNFIDSNYNIAKVRYHFKDWWTSNCFFSKYKEVKQVI